MTDNGNGVEVKQEQEQETPITDSDQSETTYAQVKGESAENEASENIDNLNDAVNSNGDGDEQIQADGAKTEETDAAASKSEKELEEGSLINATENNDAKMFIGGLSWDTETFNLREYFSEFGKVRDCTIKKDSKTSRSRGFGFVLFEEPESVDKVLKQSIHHLDGRKIDPKRAEAQRKDGKMFVGGINPETTDETIKNHFSQYGEIEQYERPTDKVTHKPRGFCFITFKKDGVLKQAIANKKPEIDGKVIDVKEAVNQPDRGGRFVGRGGGMGGRGGWGGPPGYGGGFGYGGGYGGGYDGYGGGYSYGGGYGPGGYGNYGGFQGGYGGGGKGLKAREGLGRRRGGGWGDMRTHTNHTNWYGHRGNFHGAYHGFHDY